MMDNHMFIVLRGCPPSLAALEGKWYEVAHLNGGPVVVVGTGGLLFWPTGCHEVKGIGKVAAVYEPRIMDVLRLGFFLHRNGGSK